MTPEIILHFPIAYGTFDRRNVQMTRVDDVPMTTRIAQRLENLGKHILPKWEFPRHPHEASADFARRFLECRGYTKVFAGEPMTIPPSTVRRLLSAAAAIYKAFIVDRGWNTLSFGFTDTMERGHIFWDVFNAKDKFCGDNT